MKETIKTEVLKQLDFYVPIVARVHGEHHPEFHEVKELYVSLSDKIRSDQDLREELTRLREVTSGYLVPDDVCETYEAVYQMLSEIDHEYSK